MKIETIAVEEATEAAMKGYGRVIEAGCSAPDAEETGFRFWYNLVEAEMNPLAISIVEALPTVNMTSDTLEAHFRTPEALVPLEGDVVVVLAKPQPNNREEPDLQSVKAFSIPAGKGVVLDPGIWHRAPLTREKSVKTLCLIRKGTPDDLILHDLAQKFGVNFRVE